MKKDAQSNLERILARAEEIIEADTAKMPVGEAIIVANRFAETCTKLRKMERPTPPPRP